MLLQYSDLLKRLSIVLASQSPRRHQIFKENLGITQFRVIVSNFKEDIDKATCTGPEDYVSRTCRMKCEDVINSISSSSSSSSSSKNADVIISSDTIVVLDNIILEKPSDRDAAFAMLRSLSGRTNVVLTAVTIASLKNKESRIDSDASAATAPLLELYDVKTFCQSSNVKFADLSDEVINAYIDSGEPFDKAGGYGMQSLGASLVTSIEGCFFNVMGFPVYRFCEEFMPILIKMSI